MVIKLFKKLFILTIILLNSFLIGQTAYANWSGSTATGAEDSDPSVTINFTAAANSINPKLIFKVSIHDPELHKAGKDHNQRP